jgi:hypothetical protein
MNPALWKSAAQRLGQTTARGAVLYPGYEHNTWAATVQTIEPERHFSFTLHPYLIDHAIDDRALSTAPSTLVEFSLEPKDGGTLLILTESGYHDFPKKLRLDHFRANDKSWTSEMTRIKHHVGEPA